MDRRCSVRTPYMSGCVGERPINASDFESGDSPFILFLTNAQIQALAEFVELHGLSCPEAQDHAVESYACWSSDLSTVEELHVACSCGLLMTFDQFGKGVK